jgi:hypothetical protein
LCCQDFESMEAVEAYQRAHYSGFGPAVRTGSRCRVHGCDVTHSMSWVCGCVRLQLVRPCVYAYICALLQTEQLWRDLAESSAKAVVDDTGKTVFRCVLRCCPRVVCHKGHRSHSLGVWLDGVLLRRLAYDPNIRAAFATAEPADVSLWPVFDKVRRVRACMCSRGYRCACSLALSRSPALLLEVIGAMQRGFSPSLSPVSHLHSHRSCLCICAAVAAADDMSGSARASRSTVRSASAGRGG